MFLEPRGRRLTLPRAWVSAVLLVLCLAMDDFSPECWEDEYVKIEMEELQHEIDESGVSNIEEFLRKKLERW